MPTISAEEWQLLSFFEVEPELTDIDVPWCYNDALYQVQQGDLTLSVAIAPSYRDVRLILKNRGKRVYELNAMGVRDVRYCKEDTVETLKIDISVRESLTLRLKPSIELTHRIEQPA
jgi:hypothetical protein